MEAIHFLDFDGFVVEGLGVVFERKVEQLIVEVEEGLVAEGFAEVSPGEGGFELEGTGHFAPPDFVLRGTFARE